ncbi:MAG TPA: hypothetical protein PLR99_01725 [Polyangiaceae bacterium]|nr:hypothetical protein [Polyangiaceae bacterium]
MSEKSKKSSSKKEAVYTIEGTPWANAWKIAAGVGGVGLLVSLSGLAIDPKRFAFSYLFAFVAFLLVGLGSVFFILINRMTSAGWSVTVRRVAEFCAAGLVAFPVLFVPVLLSAGHLFPWWNGAGEHGGGEHHASIALVAEAQAAQHGAAPEHAAPPAAGEHGAAPAHDAKEHAAPAGHGEHAAGPQDPHHVAHAATLAAKAAFLQKPFFLVRAAAYLAIWCALGLGFLRISTRQDTTKDPEDTVAAARVSPLAAWAFGLSLTFAMFDWVMGLDPAWFSTIFGVYLFACSTVAAFAVLIFLTMSLRDSGPLKGMVNVEHFHDMGKLLFGFNGFWAYIGFSQYMLIWYAGLPEETTYYHARGLGQADSSWRLVSIGLMAAHFVIPFFMLISRHAKRNLGILKMGTVWLFVVHLIDIYWFILPNLTKEVSPHWLDLTCVAGVGGAYFATVFYFMGKHQLIPVGDPRLKRALAFEQA